MGAVSPSLNKHACGFFETALGQSAIRSPGLLIRKTWASAVWDPPHQNDTCVLQHRCASYYNDSQSWDVGLGASNTSCLVSSSGTCINTQTDTHANKHTHLMTHGHPRTYTHIHTHTYTHTPARTHTYFHCRLHARFVFLLYMLAGWRTSK